MVSGSCGYAHVESMVHKPASEDPPAVLHDARSYASQQRKSKRHAEVPIEDEQCSLVHVIATAPKQEGYARAHALVVR